MSETLSTLGDWELFDKSFLFVSLELYALMGDFFFVAVL